MGLENQQARLTESSVEVRAARLLLLGSARRFMACLEAGQGLTDEDARQTERDALSNQMQRAFRDVYAAGAHVALNWDRISVNYGRSVMGMPVASIF